MATGRPTAQTPIVLACGIACGLAGTVGVVAARPIAQTPRLGANALTARITTAMERPTAMIPTAPRHHPACDLVAPADVAHRVDAAHRVDVAHRVEGATR